MILTIVNKELFDKTHHYITLQNQEDLALPTTGNHTPQNSKKNLPTHSRTR